MSERDPLVSVIIPTFNREAYLREAIASVFAQSYSNWELIVVDDGSTDGTRADLVSLTDRRMHVVPLEHCGNPARLRNVALARAAGRYVAFLDSDDMWMPEKLELQIGDLMGHPDRRWSYTYCKRIDQYGAEVPLPRGKRWRPYAGCILEALIAADAWVAMPAVVVEREAMRGIGGFDETLLFCEDYDAWLRLSMRWPASVLARPLAVVCEHPGSSSKGRVESLECWVRVYQKLMADPALRPMRRLCRRRYAYSAVFLANYYRGTASYARAFATLLRSFPHRPAYPAWWLALLKTCVRPLMPPAAMRTYRAIAARMRRGGS